MPGNDSPALGGSGRGARVSTLNAAKYTNGSDARAKSASEFTIDEFPLVEPGTYQVHLTTWWTGLMFGKRPKLALTFRILTPGSAFGVELKRWYNVKQLIGKPGVRGRFHVGRSSEFLYDYATLGMPVERLDRFALSKLREVVLEAKVKTVTKDHKQRDIPEPLKYSVIESLQCVTAGNVESPSFKNRACLSCS